MFYIGVLKYQKSQFIKYNLTSLKFIKDQVNLNQNYKYPVENPIILVLNYSFKTDAQTKCMIGSNDIKHQYFNTLLIC